MKREKSCGALVIRKNGEQYDLVLLRHRFGGHWSFPKGHVEAGETERQTALREVKEETGLSIRLYDGFRESVEYFPQAGVKKQVGYFLGAALGDELIRQEEEKYGVVHVEDWIREDDSLPGNEKISVLE